ncbi:uncharacterized protein LOC143300787 [Babylonia areolata]|uniref:uncharacterized protein LOC143300787 n=1 Tax=Babylonia areolata TaxID=304850 RepID=UPI003FD34FA8
MAESKYSDVSAMADTSTPTTVVNVTTGKPWLVRFTGEDIESYPVWRHQLSSLISNRYPEKEVSNAIRSSLHGQAGRVLIRMGTDASVSDIIKKMDSIYGTVDTESDLLATFYGARQGPGESVADWSCRLEEILDQVKKQAPLPSSPNEMLRTMLWTGLRCELKDISMYIYDRIKDFDELRTALRRLEKQHPQFNVPKKPVVSKMNQSSEETSAIKKLTSQIQQLTNEMANLKKQVTSNAQSQQRENQPQYWRTKSAAAQEESQSHYTPETKRHHRDRSSVSSQCRIQCYRCGQFDHVAAGCRVRLDHLKQDFHRKPMTRGDS